MKYAISATPSPALLGASVQLTLSALADVDTADALTFEHKSLTIELQRVGNATEPWVSLPNRRVIEADGMLFREESVGGTEDMSAGASVTREFVLEQLFPLEVLAPGAFALTYSLATQTREVRPQPFALDIHSGPASVEALFAVLDTADAARRSVAATLLRQMTRQGDSYDAFASVDERTSQLLPWRAWWTANGTPLPWSFESEGATHGEKPAPPLLSGLSAKLGGIAFDAPPAP